MKVHVDGLGVVTMSISLENVNEKYLATKNSLVNLQGLPINCHQMDAWGKGVDVDAALHATSDCVERPCRIQCNGRWSLLMCFGAEPWGRVPPA